MRQTIGGNNLAGDFLHAVNQGKDNGERHSWMTSPKAKTINVLSKVRAIQAGRRVSGRSETQVRKEPRVFALGH